MQAAKHQPGKPGLARDAKASRSFNMSRIRSKNTKAELLLRRAMWAAKIRFRIHADSLPGKPDVLIAKYRLAIFVDGAFWHGFEWEKNSLRIKSNIGFWTAKIESNMRRDAQVNSILSERGYTVMRFWDHQVKNELPRCINQIQLYIESCRMGAIPQPG